MYKFVRADVQQDFSGAIRGIDDQRAKHAPFGFLIDLSVVH